MDQHPKRDAAHVLCTVCGGFALFLLLLRLFSFLFLLPLPLLSLPFLLLLHPTPPPPPPLLLLFLLLLLLSVVSTDWNLWKCHCDLCDRLPFPFAYPFGSFVHCYLRCHVILCSNSLTSSNPGSRLLYFRRTLRRICLVIGDATWLLNRFFIFYGLLISPLVFLHDISV